MLCQWFYTRCLLKKKSKTKGEREGKRRRKGGETKAKKTKEKRRRKRRRKGEKEDEKKNASVSQCLNASMHLSGSQTKFLRCQSPFESFVVSRESYNIWKSVVARRKQKKGYPSCRVIHAFCPPNQFPPVSCLASRLTHIESPARQPDLEHFFHEHCWITSFQTML